MATTFLNLNLPIVTVTLGPVWANQINAAFETIDAHDHSSGKGLQIPTAGININADLDFNEKAALNLKLVSMENRTSTPSGASFATSLSTYAGNLFYTNASGVAIQLTAGGGIVPSSGNAQVFEPQNVSSNITISPSDTFVYLITDTTSSRNITLPLANSVTAGRVYIVKDASGLSNTNPISILAAGSDLVDSGASQTLNSDFSSWTIVTDGVSNWYIS
jgi:hypothetical protein